jgi:hypothetical protein
MILLFNGFIVKEADGKIIKKGSNKKLYFLKNII